MGGEACDVTVAIMGTKVRNRQPGCHRRTHMQFQPITLRRCVVAPSAPLRLCASTKGPACTSSPSTGSSSSPASLISFVPASCSPGGPGRSTAEFFTSGRSAPWWLVGVSMVATTFSTDTPNLVTNLVREKGVANNWQWWAFLLTGMATVFFYARLWRRSRRAHRPRILRDPLFRQAPRRSSAASAPCTWASSSTASSWRR